MSMKNASAGPRGMPSGYWFNCEPLLLPMVGPPMKMVGVFRWSALNMNPFCARTFSSVVPGIKSINL